MPITRSELVADQLAHPPWGSRGYAPDDPPVRVGATGSGTELLLLGWTAAELAVEVAAGATLFGRAGVVPGMRVANTLPGALVTPGALLLGDVIEAIGARVEGDALVVGTPAYASGLRARAVEACRCGGGPAFAL